MKFQAVSIPKRGMIIANFLTDFSLPYRDAFGRAGTSGNDLWTAFSYNNFNNPLNEADRARYLEMGYWYEILRDRVREGDYGTDGKGRLHVLYISNAETNLQGEDKVWAPPNGWPVPNCDCTILNGEWNPFYPRTAVPFETAPTKEEAAKRREKAGIPPDAGMHFFRRHKYEEDYYAGRGFSPHGDFNIHLDFRQDFGGGADKVGYRPKIADLRKLDILEI